MVFILFILEILKLNMTYANFDMKKYSLILIFSSIVIGVAFPPNVYGEDDISKNITKKMLIQLYII